MATQLQIRRGTTAQMNAFTGAEGELAVNTTTDTVHVHDGSTAGGFALAKADGSNIATYAGSFTTLAASGASTLTGAVGINITPTSYKLTVNSGVTTETTAAAIGYNGDAGTTLYVNTDHGNNLVSLYASGDVSKEMRFLSGTLEVMRLGTTGNVGIGTSSPSTKGHFYSTTSMDQLTVDGAGAIESGINFASGGTTYGQIYFNNVSPYDMSVMQQYTSGSLIFGTNDTERMRIDASGNAGIGTSSPVSFGANTAGLTVNGSSGSHITWQNNGTNVAFAYPSGNNFIIGSEQAGSNTIFTAAGAERMRIDPSGNLLVGTTSAAQDSGSGVKLRLDSGQARCFLVADALTGEGFSMRAGGAYKFFVGYNGTINATNTTISGISDVRYKENIRDLDDGLAKVMQLQPRKFDWKEGKGKDIANDRGFIAQEFEEVFPDLISEWKDPAPEGEEPYKAVSQDLIPTLVKAIQEQQATIEALTQRIQTLENN